MSKHTSRPMEEHKMNKTMSKQIKKAVEKTENGYKGYYDANAVSLYLYEKYGYSLVDIAEAQDLYFLVNNQHSGKNAEIWGGNEAPDGSPIFEDQTCYALDCGDEIMFWIFDDEEMSDKLPEDYDWQNPNYFHKSL